MKEPLHNKDQDFSYETINLGEGLVLAKLQKEWFDRLQDFD